jgi:hypothetical protein
MPSNHSVCKVYAVFLLLEAKEAVGVIEATKVFKITRSLKINNANARIVLF